MYMHINLIKFTSTMDFNRTAIYIYTVVLVKRSYSKHVTVYYRQ